MNAAAAKQQKRPGGTFLEAGVRARDARAELKSLLLRAKGTVKEVLRKEVPPSMFTDAKK